MDRRFRTWLTVVLTCTPILTTTTATSAPKDAAATKLADDAINTDYLATNFAEAEKKLRKAVQACGTSGCSAQVRARLHRDLGVVLVGGLNRPEDGKKAFIEALKADPNIALEKYLTTPEIDAAFQAAKGGGAPAGKAAPSPAAPAFGGDLSHTPPVEGAVNTPLALYA
ncbi:MAG TPA: hypothetical protein VJT73_05330, partial [Polyangiaceae bacterium]|nr:hypothetical protein [Polyangiaceae bacterium]